MQRCNPLRVLAILTLAAATGCATAPTTQEEIDRALPLPPETNDGSTAVSPAELITVRPAYIGTWKSTDPAALSFYFADNAVVTSPQGTFEGWNNIQSGWIAPMMKGMSNYTVMPANITWTDNDITETGRFSYRVTRDDGGIDVKALGYTQRWRMQPDRSWKIVSVDVE
jgi:hypothetical protein